MNYRSIFFLIAAAFTAFSTLRAEQKWQAIPLNTAGYEWMDAIVDKEFTRYEESGFSRSLLERTWNAVHDDRRFKRYKIISSKVYGPEGRMKNLLDVMVMNYPVPDVDFIYYHEDILREQILSDSGLSESAPIFVSAKHYSQERVILFTDWYYDIKSEQGGWNHLIESINANQERFPWSQKINKLFWRGSDTDISVIKHGKYFDQPYTIKNWGSFPRGFSVFLTERYPSLIDARFTHYIPCTEDLKKFKKRFPLAPHISVADHLAYKYQLLLDGVTCTFPGTQWRLFSGCLTMKHETTDIMWFYQELIPWRHYIPLKHNLSDVVEKVEWAIANDAQAEQIALNAREFALTHLMPEHVLLYCYKALVKYASLQRFQPVS